VVRSSEAEQPTIIRAGLADAVPRVVEIEAPDVWDVETARVMGRWRLWRDGTPKREVTLDVDTDRWSWLRVGDVVTYTETGLHLDQAVALVLSVERTDEALAEVGLLLV